MLAEKRPCMNCRQNAATVKLTKLSKGNVAEIYLCQDCAAAQSPYQKKMPQLDEILAGILGQTSVPAMSITAENETPEITCGTCGLPFASYRESLLLGCSDCYDNFGSSLIADLRKFHGQIEHTGRKPNAESPQINHLRSPAELKRRLQEAIRAEDYELAIRLRDELRRSEASAVNPAAAG